MTILKSPPRDSYGKNEWAVYGFEFYKLPSASGATLNAKAYDVFGNSATTAQTTYNCIIKQTTGSDSH